MPLRIAMTGVHATGKTTLSKWLVDEILTKLVSPEDIHVLGSATRATRELCGATLNEAGEDSTQLWSQVMRTFWEFEHKDKPVLISERCGLDEASYQQARVEKLGRELQSGLILSSGSVANQEKQALLQCAIATTQVLLNQGMQEISNYWDFVYWKRPWDGVSIEMDDARSDSVEYQMLVDSCFEKFISIASQVCPERVIEIPRELGEAKEFLVEEIPKWQESQNNEKIVQQLSIME